MPCPRWRIPRRVSSRGSASSVSRSISASAAAATGLRDPDGIIVVARAAGAASEVPLLPRDVIRAMNGKQMASLQVFKGAVAALPPGTPVTLQIQREGRLMYVSFTLE